MKDAVQVVIVGGGAAGIGAARRLAEAHVDYLLLESRTRLGGRAWTVADEFPLDLGCGWLHSGDINPLSGIAAANGYTIDRTPPPWTRPMSQPGFPREEQEAFSEAMKQFMQRLDSARSAPDQPASALLEENGRWNELIRAVNTYINGVELEQLSARDAAHYLDTEVNWRVTEGYGAMIADLGSGLNTALDCAVRAIDHSGLKLRIDTGRGVVRADAAVVTVPSALIAEERVRFTPALPDKLDAAASLPLGLANKLFLSLNGAEEFGKDCRLFGRTDTVATGAYHLRPFGRPMIEVYFGGSLADDLEAQGARACVDFASHELTSVLGSSFAARIRPIRLSHWRGDECARGA